jgi:Asp-tRNA(Asn)/Glu-tRNA(Gln) amidotransferase C subunit
MEYEFQRCTRRCAATGREFAPGETFYSALFEEGAELVRKDFAAESWQGPPEGAIGWWKSQMPNPNDKRMHWAPNDVMLQFFEQLAEQPDKQDMRYVLALLLVRRRVLREDEPELDEQGRQVLVLYCPRRDATYKVPTAIPTDARINEIQEELAKLLFAKAA